MRLKSILMSIMLSFVFCSPFSNSLVNNALAHEFIVKPETAQPAKGEQVKAQLQAAHVFMVSEEAEAPESVELILIQNGKKTPIAFKENKDTLSLEAIFSLPADGPAILAGHRKPQIWSQTTEGVLEGGRNELEAKGKTVIQADKYEKFAKTFLNTGTKHPEFNKPIGQELEIVPLGDLSNLKVGDELEFQLLYKGKPLVAPIWATYDGFSKEMNTYAYYTEPGTDTFKVKLTAPGLWMVRGEHTAKIKSGDAQNHIMRTVAVFEVK